MAQTNEAADRDLRIGGHGSGLTDAQMSHINALVDARIGRVEARASRYGCLVHRAAGEVAARHPTACQHLDSKGAAFICGPFVQNRAMRDTSGT